MWKTNNARTGKNSTELRIIKCGPVESTNLTVFPPKTNIFVHRKICTFSKKGLGHKGRVSMAMTLTPRKAIKDQI